MTWPSTDVASEPQSELNEVLYDEPHTIDVRYLDDLIDVSLQLSAGLLEGRYVLVAGPSGTEAALDEMQAAIEELRRLERRDSR